jgi:hypothetical protein
VKSATNFFEAGVSIRWCQTSGHVPEKLPLPAAHATAGVEAEARGREREAEFRVLLQERW